MSLCVANWAISVLQIEPIFVCVANWALSVLQIEPPTAVGDISKAQGPPWGERKVQGAPHPYRQPPPQKNIIHRYQSLGFELSLKVDVVWSFNYLCWGGRILSAWKVGNVLKWFQRCIGYVYNIYISYIYINNLIIYIYSETMWNQHLINIY